MEIQWQCLVRILRAYKNKTLRSGPRSAERNVRVLRSDLVDTADPISSALSSAVEVAISVVEQSTRREGSATAGIVEAVQDALRPATAGGGSELKNGAVIVRSPS